MGKKDDELLELQQKYLKLLDDLTEVQKLNMELLVKLDSSYAAELRVIILEKEEALLAAQDALVMYADKSLYNDYDEEGSFSTIELDGGKRARKAMKLIKSKA